MSAPRVCIICGVSLPAHAHALQRVCGSHGCYAERKRRQRNPADDRRRARQKAQAKRKALGPDPYVPAALREAARLALSAPWPAQAPGGLTS